MVEPKEPKTAQNVSSSDTCFEDYSFGTKAIDIAATYQNRAVWIITLDHYIAQLSLTRRKWITQDVRAKQIAVDPSGNLAYVGTDTFLHYKSDIYKDCT